MCVRALGRIAIALVLGAMGMPETGRAEDAPGGQHEADQADVVDGRLDEADWADAIEVPAASVQVPDLRVPLTADPPGVRTLTPRVAIRRQGPYIVIGVRADEAPGASIGLQVMVARTGHKTAGEAWSVTYRPRDLRAEALSVQGPEGAGLTVLPVHAAVDTTGAEAWSLELALPAGQLAGPASTGALRMGFGVLTRTPNLVASAPADAVWHGPDAWFELTPPTGGWVKAPDISEAAIRTRRTREEARARALTLLLSTMMQRVPDVLEAPDERMATMRKQLDEASSAMRLARPDLGVSVDVFRADLLARLGDVAAARAAYDAALAVSPGWIEARFGRDVRLGARALVDGKPGGATELASQREQLARAKAEAEAAGDVWHKTAAQWAEAVIQYRTGQWREALAGLEALRKRFEGDGWLIALHDAARKALRASPPEIRARQARPAVPPPQLVFTLPGGEARVDLYPGHQPMAVSQLVWLAQQGFYDGTRIHHTLPGVWATGGDPHSKAGPEATKVGTGDAGYAVRTQDGKRQPWRGTLCLERSPQGDVSSRFFFLTGSAIELSEQLVVVGRVASGQEHVDALTQGALVSRVRPDRLHEGVTYRPLTLEGSPAPELK